MKAHKLFMLLAVLLFTQCQSILNTNKAYDKYYDSNVSTPNHSSGTQQGECYARCLIEPRFTQKDIELAIYTGDETQENVEIQILELEIEPLTTKWEKRKKDRNCLSSDPNDCLVWCLIEVPAVIEQYKIVTDTTATTNFELTKMTRKKLIQQGVFTQFKEVLCQEQVTEDIVHQVQEALRTHRYYKGNDFSTMKQKVKNALIAFQKDHDLPIGNLDLATLDMLEIDYEDKE